MDSLACFSIERHYIIYPLEFIITFSRSRSRSLKILGAGANFFLISGAGAVPNLAGSETLQPKVCIISETKFCLGSISICHRNIQLNRGLPEFNFQPRSPPPTPVLAYSYLLPSPSSPLSSPSPPSPLLKLSIT